MKKQAKSKKTQSAKTQCTATNVALTRSRRQRFLAFIALGGLFACGLFVGMAITSPVSQSHKNVEAEATMENNFASSQNVCVEVERLLARRLPVASDDVDERIERAKIYASLAERGCIENSEMYVEMAKQELEIARAIEDDEFSHQETIDVVETYKRLNMQAAAEEIFEKAKKLTDPAIDFIIQVEKIINE